MERKRLALLKRIAVTWLPINKKKKIRKKCIVRVRLQYSFSYAHYNIRRNIYYILLRTNSISWKIKYGRRYFYDTTQYIMPVCQ